MVQGQSKCPGAGQFHFHGIVGFCLAHAHLVQIPAITYGGPPSPPEDPSPEAIKLNESLVITEFLADIFPAAGLIPADPVKRAQARIFISLVDKQLWDAFKECCVMGKSPTLVVDVLRTLQSRLPEEGFAVGEWSIADIAAAPFLARFVMLLENDLGKYPVGEGKKAFEALKQPEFGRIMRYLDDLKARPSFKATYDEVSCRVTSVNRYTWLIVFRRRPKR